MVEFHGRNNGIIHHMILIEVNAIQKLRNHNHNLHVIFYSSMTAMKTVRKIR